VRRDGLLAVPPDYASAASGAVAPPPSEAKGRVNPQTANAASEPQIPSYVVMAETPEALDIKTRLQEFARNNRELYGLTRWLASLNLEGYRNVYQSPWEGTGQHLRDNLELTLPILQNHPQDDNASPSATSTSANPPATADTPASQPSVADVRTKLAVYQDIRAASNTAQQASAFFWGAVATYALPVLYAILGMMAYTLRDLCQRSVAKTYLPVRARHINRARLVVAIIVGTVVSLFSNVFSDSGLSASHLATAFLAGYAIDAFFATIDKAVGATQNAH
jgi:hypothetical protein